MRTFVGRDLSEIDGPNSLIGGERVVFGVFFGTSMVTEICSCFCTSSSFLIANSSFSKSRGTSLEDPLRSRYALINSLIFSLHSLL